MSNFRALLPGFMKQMQCNALKIKTAAKQREYPQKSYFQATPKNTCQTFQTKKIPESKISNQKEKILPSSPSLEIRRTPSPRPVKLKFPIGWITKLKKRIPSLKCDND